MFVSFSYFFTQVITPFRRLVLCAQSRCEMEEWISAMKAASSREFYEVSLGLASTINTCHCRCHATFFSKLVMILKLHISLCIIP
jgi:hypothetical protein